MTIKFGNFTNFIVRNLLVIWEAPTYEHEFRFRREPLGKLEMRRGMSCEEHELCVQGQH